MDLGKAKESICATDLLRGAIMGLLYNRMQTLCENLRSYAIPLVCLIPDTSGAGYLYKGQIGKTKRTHGGAASYASGLNVRIVVADGTRENPTRVIFSFPDVKTVRGEALPAVELLIERTEKGYAVRANNEDTLKYILNVAYNNGSTAALDLEHARAVRPTAQQVLTELTAT
jgi:hypothetical protein